jgi:hypothetical protein
MTFSALRNKLIDRAALRLSGGGSPSYPQRAQATRVVEEAIEALLWKEIELELRDVKQRKRNGT